MFRWRLYASLKTRIPREKCYGLALVGHCKYGASPMVVQQKCSLGGRKLEQEFTHLNDFDGFISRLWLQEGEPLL